jgi:hypothetical protein
LRDRPIVWIRSENINFNESSSAYSRDKNYQALMNSTQSNQKHPLYMVVSSNLTPRQRTFCLPIQDFIDPYEATNSIDSIGGLINSIMNNIEDKSQELLEHKKIVKMKYLELFNKYLNI